MSEKRLSRGRFLSPAEFSSLQGNPQRTILTERDKKLTFSYFLTRPKLAAAALGGTFKFFGPGARS